MSVKNFIIAGLAGSVFGGAVYGTDLPEPQPQVPHIVDVTPPATVDVGGGWYIRGDVGVGVTSTHNFSNVLTGDAISGGGDAQYNTSVSEAGLVGAGVGYQFNSFLRADVTGELRGGSDLQSLEVCNNCNNHSQDSTFYRGNIWTGLLLANGYVDIGTWHNITPWVGAGVGFAYNKAYGVTGVGASYSCNCNGNSVGSPTGMYFNNADKLNLAWQVSTGLDFAITHNLDLELGYKFLDYGKFSSGASNSLCPGSATGFGCTNYKLASKELYSNDFRVGLRYSFDNVAYASNC